MKHSLGRHRRLYGLFRETSTVKHHRNLVLSFSDGRTDNSAELSDKETDDLIHHLESMLNSKQKQDPTKKTKSGFVYAGQRMRRRILSLCYTIGWTKFNERTIKHEVDWDRLNEWMLNYGHLHIPLNDYDYFGLQKLVAQFEKLAEETLTPGT